MSDSLPVGWVITALGSLGKWSSGGTPARKNSAYYGGGIPWVKTGDLNDGEILEISESITDEGLKNSSAKLFPNGSLLIAMYGATIGKLGLLNIEAATNQACTALIAEGYTKDLIPFVYYFLRANRDEFKEIGKGGAQPNISQTVIKSFPIELPPLNEQKRIVAKIEALQARSKKAREALADVPKQVEQFKQSVLAAAFRGDLTKAWREQNPDVEPAEQLLARIRTERRAKWEADQLATYEAKGKTPPKNWQSKYKEPAPVDTTDLPELPDGWCWGSIEELASVGTGATPNRSNEKFWIGGSVPWVTSGALNNDVVNEASEYITDLAIRETNCSLFPIGTLLVAMYGEGKTRGMCSELALSAATNQAVAGIVFEGVSLDIRPFVKIFLQKNYADMRMLASGGVQPNLNLTLVKRIVVPLPCYDEQHQITQRIESLFAYADSILEQAKSSLKELDRLDQSILAKAFRGELVPQDPNDEPASVLLERIKAERAAAAPVKRSRKKAVSC